MISLLVTIHGGYNKKDDNSTAELLQKLIDNVQKVTGIKYEDHTKRDLSSYLLDTEIESDEDDDDIDQIESVDSNHTEKKTEEERKEWWKFW